MGNAHRVAVNTLILYARMAITVFLSLYTTRLVLGTLGTDDFGIFNLVGGTIAMLTFLNASMAAATQRFMSFAQGQGDERRQQQIFNVSIVLHAIIAFVVLGLLEITGYWLFKSVFKIEPERMQAAWMVYQYAAISTFFTILSVPYDAAINAREHMLLFAILSIIEAILKLGVALVIIDVATDKLEFYGLLMALVSIFLLIIRVAYCHKKYQECKIAPWQQLNRPLFKEMTSFAGWSFLGSSTSMLTNYGQVVVLNIFFGPSVNAAQSIAIQLSGQLSSLSDTMRRALTPIISKSEGAGNRQLMIKASSLGSKVGFFLLTITIVPLLVELPYVLQLWLKNVPQFTIMFCGLQLLIKLLEQLFLTLTTSIAAVGDIRNYQIVTSAITILPLPISYFLFKIGQPPYALYFVFIGYTIILALITFHFAGRYCEIQIWDYFRSVVIKCLTLFSLIVLVSAIPILFLDQGLNRLLSVGLISFISSSVIIWQLGFDQYEKKIIGATIYVIFSRINSLLFNLPR